MLMKGDDHSKQVLLSVLRKIDEHLGQKKSRFLTGDTLCCFDCELMPKLQHIRVAGTERGPGREMGCFASEKGEVDVRYHKSLLN